MLLYARKSGIVSCQESMKQTVHNPKGAPVTTENTYKWWSCLDIFAYPVTDYLVYLSCHFKSRYSIEGWIWFRWKTWTVYSWRQCCSWRCWRMGDGWCRWWVEDKVFSSFSITSFVLQYHVVGVAKYSALRFTVVLADSCRLQLLPTPRSFLGVTWWLKYLRRSNFHQI